jgi:hypothetical protein
LHSDGLAIVKNTKLQVRGNGWGNSWKEEENHRCGAMAEQEQLSNNGQAMAGEGWGNGWGISWKEEENHRCGAMAQRLHSDGIAIVKNTKLQVLGNGWENSGGAPACFAVMKLGSHP